MPKSPYAGMFEGLFNVDTHLLRLEKKYPTLFKKDETLKLQMQYRKMLSTISREALSELVSKIRNENNKLISPLINFDAAKTYRR